MTYETHWQGECFEGDTSHPADCMVYIAYYDHGWGGWPVCEAHLQGVLQVCGDAAQVTSPGVPFAVYHGTGPWTDLAPI